MEFVRAGDKLINLENVLYIEYQHGGQFKLYFAASTRTLVVGPRESAALRELLESAEVMTAEAAETHHLPEKAKKKALEYITQTWQDKPLTAEEDFVELYRQYLAWCDTHNHPLLDLHEFRYLLEERSDINPVEGTDATADIARP